jgi:RNA polymerase sigma-70 factor (ECF subfamily)
LALAASRAALGDTTALHFLHARLADEVHECVGRIVGDPATTSAVGESVFTDLPRTIGAYEPREMPFDVWLLGLAADTARRHHAEAAERSRAARDALWALPPDERYVLVLRHLVGLSTDEIAARLGKTEGAVRRLDERGRAALTVDPRQAQARSVLA